MAFLDQLKKNTAAAGQFMVTAGQMAADKAKQTADILKIKEQIRQEKKEIRKMTYQIGQTYIRLHGDDYTEEYAEYFCGLEEAKKKLAQRQKELQQANEQKKCAECGKELAYTEEYCSHCGTAAAYETELKEEKILEASEPEEEETEESEENNGWEEEK